MGAALVAKQCMYLIDNEAAGRGQHRTPAGAGEQQIEGFRRGHQDVGRLLRHARPLARRRVARAHSDADIDRRAALQMQLFSNAVQRLFEILADVVAKRLKRRDVDDLHAIAEGVSLAALKQRVYCRIERRKSLTAARGRGDKRVAACRNMPPRLALRRRRRAKTTLEPRTTGGVETREAVGCVWRRLHAE